MLCTIVQVDHCIHSLLTDSLVMRGGSGVDPHNLHTQVVVQVIVKDALLKVKVSFEIM